MDMKSNIALDRVLDQIWSASERFPQGSIIEHVCSGNVYVVVAHCIREETLEACILYESFNKEQDSGILWERPFREFIQEVEYPIHFPVESGARFRIIK